MNGVNQGKVLGELEAEIMRLVWDAKKPILVKTVTEALQKNRRIAYTTVMTIMGRLVEKGLLKRKPYGKAFLYQAVYSKDKFLTRVTRQIINNFISNFGDAAIAHFAEEIDKIPAQKRKELLEILKKSNG